MSLKPNTTGTVVTAVALAVAGGTHIAAYGEHRAQSAAAAAFFALVAVAQVGAALAVLRGAGRRLRVAVVVGNLLLIGLWAWSRTTGLQIGPDAGPAEPVGVLDLTAVAAQAVAVTAALMAPGARLAVNFLRPQLMLVGVAVFVGAAGLQLPAHAGDHHEFGESHETHETEKHGSHVDHGDVVHSHHE
ncbi:MAG TPA: hypothetical protein VMZ22_02825 [Acidimicrobiales bacterium]|nr:hypothetical protein [Acidimicrobiales bacterium]